MSTLQVSSILASWTRNRNACWNPSQIALVFSSSSSSSPLLDKNSSLRENVEVASCRWTVVHIYIYISIAGRSERFKGVHPPHPLFQTPWNISLIRFIRPLSAIRMLKRISAFLLHLLLLFSGFPRIREEKHRVAKLELPHLLLPRSKLFKGDFLKSREENKREGEAQFF